MQLRVEAFRHPTEDLDRVKVALAELTPTKPVITRIRGQFGETIEMLVIDIKGKESEQLWQRLEPLAGEPDENGNSYVRLDKQSLFKGELKKGKSVRVTVKP